MSTTPAPHPEAVLPVPAPDREIRIYSHSALFYWWPVWACGFIMCIVTWLDGGRMYVVPKNTEIANNATVQYQKGDQSISESFPTVLMVPKTTSGKEPNVDTLGRWMTRNKDLGLVFATVLLAIILATNVPLRGLWSVVLVLIVVLVIVILALTPWLTTVINAIGAIDIRLNFGGYFAISAVLFVMWVLAVFIFDRRMYMAITSGQVRVCTAIGTGETVYDTAGLTFQKRQDDLFRHWIIGLGSGDLVLHRTNVNQEIDFPNVLFIGGKIREIEKLIKEKEVV